MRTEKRKPSPPTKNSTKPEPPSRPDYLMVLKNLLAELRIDTVALTLMANGKSPDLPNAAPKGWTNTFCKIQLSKATALDIFIALYPEIMNPTG